MARQNAYQGEKDLYPDIQNPLVVDPTIAQVQTGYPNVHERLKMLEDNLTMAIAYQPQNFQGVALPPVQQPYIINKMVLPPQKNPKENVSGISVKQCLMFLLYLLMAVLVAGIIILDLRMTDNDNFTPENDNKELVSQERTPATPWNTMQGIWPIIPKLCMYKDHCPPCPAQFFSSCNEDCLCMCTANIKNDSCPGINCNSQYDCICPVGRNRRCNEKCKCECVTTEAENKCQRCHTFVDCPWCGFTWRRFCDLGCTCRCLESGKPDECPQRCTSHYQCPACPYKFHKYCDAYCHCRYSPDRRRDECAQRCKTRHNCTSCPTGNKWCSPLCQCECVPEPSADECMLGNDN